MSTIGTKVNQGITLGTVTQNGTYASPLTITSTGYVSNPGSGDAVLGPNTAAWYLNNQGTVTATNGSGVDLKAGGTVINSGHITGAGVSTQVGPGFAGVYIGGTTGVVNNSGTISGPAGVDLYAGGTVIDSGLIAGTGLALFMDQPGYVSIASTGTVSGKIGIEIANLFQAIGPSTVINSGVVIGSQYYASPGRYFGAYIGSGGTLVNNASGTISGMVFANRGPLTVIDYGTITSPKGPAIYLLDGGRITIGNFPTAGAGAARGVAGAAGVGGGLPETEADVGGDIILAGAAALGGNYLGAFFVGMKAKVGGHLIFLRPEGTSSGSSGVVSSAGATAPNTTIVNYGTMQATSGYAISLDAWHPTITNGAPTITSALISGSFAGIGILDAPGTVTNFGTIVGTAGTGVILAAGSTLTNAGSIVGQGGTAVSMLGTSGNRVVVDPGAYFKGVVLGGAGVVELAVGNGTAGALRGFGPTITNFSTLQLDGGADWTVEGSAAGFPATITGFAAGDTIDVDGFVAVSETFANNALVLTDTASNQVTLGIQGGFSTNSFAIPGDGNGGTDVVVAACFCRGTLIRSEAGEVPVEELAIGDRLVTVAGAVKPIRWIGWRAYDGRFVAGNRAVLPIRIAAGALAEGVPARDLLVSPEHALYIPGSSPGTGVLVPAGQLVNGATIVRTERVERLEYFNIEFDEHEILVAEGAPTESYVDCDNRLMFANGGEYARLYPQDDRPRWRFCAPRLDWDMGELTAIRAALLERAEALGHALALDPDLHLIVDGAIVRPDTVAGGIHRFHLPAGSATVWLASRSTVPTEIDAASRDIRRLGVAVERIALNDADLSIEAWHGHAALCDGFHDDEGSHRWTDGLARLPEVLLRRFAGGVTLEVHLVPNPLAYRLAAPPRTAAAAA